MLLISSIYFGCLILGAFREFELGSLLVLIFGLGISHGSRIVLESSLHAIRLEDSGTGAGKANDLNNADFLVMK